MQITWTVVLIGLSILLFEVFPEKDAWSIPGRQTDEHTIVVPSSGGFSLLLMEKGNFYLPANKAGGMFYQNVSHHRSFA